MNIVSPTAADDHSERYLRAGLLDKMPHCAHVNANRKSGAHANNPRR